MVAHHIDVRDRIEEFLLNPIRGEKGHSLWLATVCAIFLVLWDERNSRVF